MIRNYITLSLETHLFFSRIMKEHALFIEAGFPCADKDWIERADHFRQQHLAVFTLIRTFPGWSETYGAVCGRRITGRFFRWFTG